MIRTSVFEYSRNTIISIVLALAVFLPFYLLFGNTMNIWIAVAVVGIPHFIIGSLGYLSPSPKKLAGNFIAGVILALFISWIYYFFFPLQFQITFFLLYFVWHMLTDEQLFEGTIRTGYERWQNSWPVAVSWGSILLVLTSLVIATLYFIKFNSPVVLTLFWVLFLIAFAAILLGVFRAKENHNVPYGYLFFFVAVFIPLAFIAGIFWKGEFWVLPVLLGIYHFVSWYVFYTRRLLLKARNPQNGVRGNLIFSWKNSVGEFWKFVFVLQVIVIILALVYLKQRDLVPLKYLINPAWVPFWTIMHVTTSFLPKKPVEMPRLGFSTRLFWRKAV